MTAISLTATSIGYHVQIIGNVCDGAGIYVEGLDAAPATMQGSAVISDNQILEPNDQHGIELDSVNKAIVHHNLIVSNSRTGAELDTWDGIHLDADCDFNLIDHNQIVTSDSGDWRYGVNVLGDCNRTVGNVLGDPADYGTDAINDGGIDNAWTYPDDPVYGDNFTICETPSS